MFSFCGSGHHACPDRGLTGAIVPFRVLIAPFILQAVASPPSPAYVVIEQKGSGMSVFRPSRQRAAHRRKHGQGFTLVELMITVAVFAIVAAIAAPAMQAMVAASRLNGATSELVTALQLARSEAIRRNARVMVCASADGATCSGSGDWSRWIVTGPDNVAGTIDTIRDRSANADLRLSGPGAGITFNPSGLIRAQQGLTVCAPTTKVADNQRVITILISGVVSYAKSGSAGVCS